MKRMEVEGEEGPEERRQKKFVRIDIKKSIMLLIG